MPLNPAWHQDHPLRPKATTQQRILWHAEHALECGCRDVPQDLREAVEALTRQRARKRSQLPH